MFLFSKLYWTLGPILEKKITTLVISCRTTVLQNSSQCLLLHVLKKGHEILFSLSTTSKRTRGNQKKENLMKQWEKKGLKRDSNTDNSLWFLRNFK